MKTREAAAAQPAPAWNRRGLAALACAATCALVALAYAGPGWAELVYRALTDGALLLAWLAGAYGIGSLAPLPRGGRETRPLRVVTRVASGLGATSLLTLGLGLAGAMNRATAVAMIAIGLALTGWRVAQSRAMLSADVRHWWNARAGAGWLWSLAMPMLAIALVAALVPPGVLWGDEPNGYDVVEYHLQIPREWYEAGRITPLRHNVFSFFPFNVEMQYLLAMHLRGGPWAGMYLAQLMHVGYVGFSVAAVYAAARSIGGSGTIAGVVAAGVPWLALLAPVAYNEGGLLLYGTLAVGWTLHALRDPQRRVPVMSVAGAMAGLACGVKLTAGPMLLAPLPVALVVIAAARREPLKRAVIGAVLFAAIGVALFAPWLVRNVAWAGNPVFPEAQAVLGRAHFTEAQSQRWHAAHAPRADQRGAGARLRAAWGQIVRDARHGYALLPLALACAALTHRRAETWLLLAMLLVFTVVWLGFTHLQSRFFVLAIPVAAVLVAQARGKLGRTLGTTAAIVVAIVGIATLHPRLTSYLHERRLATLLGFETISAFMTPAATKDVPADATLALVGDAKAFAYQRPMSQLRYRTVFDVAEASDGLTAWLGGAPQPDTVILIDPSELERFGRTYSNLAPVTQDVLDRREPYVLTRGDGG